MPRTNPIPHADFAPPIDRAAASSTAIRLDVTDRLRLGGPAQSISASWPYVYYGAGRDLFILQPGSGPQPDLVGHIGGLPGPAQGVKEVGDHAWVAAGRAGLLAIDVADPARPRLVGRLPLRGDAFDVAVAGTHAFVVDFDGLRVVDIADPARPTLVGELDTPGVAEGVDVMGDLVYVADVDSLRVVDVSDPTRPREVHVRSTAPRLAVDIVLDGRRYGYLSYIDDIDVIDLVQPRAPAPVARISIGSDVRSIALDPPYLYVANGGALAVLDVADPERPQHIDVASRYRENVRAVAASRRGVALFSHDAVALPPSALELYRHAAAGQLESEGRLALGGPPSALGGTPDDLLVAAGATLWRIDATDPAAPRAATLHAARGPVRAVQRLEDGIVAAAEHEIGLSILRAASLGAGDPAPLTQRTVFDDKQMAGAAVLAADGSTLLAGTDWQPARIHALDLADPGRPQWLGSVALPDDPGTAIATDGGRTYVGFGDCATDAVRGIAIVDTPEAAAPKLVAHLRLTDAVDALAASADRLFAVTHGCPTDTPISVRVFDASDPRQIRELGSRSLAGLFSRPFPMAIAVQANLALVAPGDAGVVALDVADPAAIREVGRIATDGLTSHVLFQGDRAAIAVAAFAGGIDVLLVQVSDAIAVGSPTPTTASSPTTDPTAIGPQSTPTPTSTSTPTASATSSPTSTAVAMPTPPETSPRAPTTRLIWLPWARQS